MTVQRNEIIQNIVEIVASILCEHGIDRPVAEQVGNNFADELTTTYGGKQFCISKDIDTFSFVKNRSAKTSIKQRATNRRYDLLDYFKKTITGLMSDLHLSIPSEEVGALLVDKFTKVFLYQNFVIPKDTKYKRYQRDQELLKDFNGWNVGYLADKYGLSESAIYRILRKY